LINSCVIAYTIIIVPQFPWNNIKPKKRGTDYVSSKSEVVGKTFFKEIK